jgi:hypothetical protein
MRLHGQAGPDADHVRDVPAGQRVAEIGVLPVAGVGHHHRRHQTPPGQFVQGVQGQAPLLPVPDAIGHPGPAPAPGIVRPLLGQEQPPVQRDGGGVGDRVHAHRDLAVGLLAQSAAVLVRDGDRHPAVLGERHVVDRPGIRTDQRDHPLRDPPLYRNRIPRRLVHESHGAVIEPSGPAYASALQDAGALALFELAGDGRLPIGHVDVSVVLLGGRDVGLRQPPPSAATASVYADVRVAVTPAASSANGKPSTPPVSVCSHRRHGMTSRASAMALVTEP